MLSELQVHIVRDTFLSDLEVERLALPGISPWQTPAARREPLLLERKARFNVEFRIRIPSENGDCHTALR